MNKQSALIGLTSWNTAWVVYAMCNVGRPMNSGTYSWGLPVSMLVLLGVTALLGYYIGKDSD